MTARSSVTECNATTISFLKKHPVVSKRNLDFTIKWDELGPSLLALRKHQNHISESGNYTDNNAECTGKPRQRPSFSHWKREVPHRMVMIAVLPQPGGSVGNRGTKSVYITQPFLKPCPTTVNNTFIKT